MPVLTAQTNSRRLFCADHSIYAGFELRADDAKHALHTQMQTKGIQPSLGRKLVVMMFEAT